MNDPDQPFRSGIVALCGRPNVGKSTLVNALVGEPVAVSTRFPQTTRERMLAAWQGSDHQVVLVDTPGIHRAKSALNRFMVDEAIRGTRGVDCVLLLAEAPRFRDDAQLDAWTPGPGARAALEAAQQAGAPVVLVLTKCDLLVADDHVLPVIDRWRALHDFADVVPTAALSGGNLDALREVILSHIPPGEPLFEDERLTDRDMRWHVQELVRASLFEHLADELPYSCAVVVEAYREGRSSDRIRATIHVERESQKGIVIGKGGRTIKAISQGARPKIEQLSGRPCTLLLDVRVSEQWSKDPRQLERLGYRDREDA